MFDSNLRYVIPRSIEALLTRIGLWKLAVDCHSDNFTNGAIKSMQSQYIYIYITYLYISAVWYMCIYSIQWGIIGVLRSLHTRQVHVLCLSRSTIHRAKHFLFSMVVFSSFEISTFLYNDLYLKQRIVLEWWE